MSGTNGVDLRALQWKLIAGVALERLQRNHPLSGGGNLAGFAEASAYDSWEGWKELARKLGYPEKTELAMKAYYLVNEVETLSSTQSRRAEMDGLLQDLTSTPAQPRTQRGASHGPDSDVDNIVDVENIVDEEAAMASQPLEPTLDKNASVRLSSVKRPEKDGNSKVTCWQVKLPGDGQSVWLQEKVIRTRYPYLGKDLDQLKLQSSEGMILPQLGSDSQDVDEIPTGKRPVDGASTELDREGKRQRSGSQTAAAPMDVDEGPPRILTNSSGAGPSGTHSSFQLGQGDPISSPDTDSGLGEPFFNSLPSPNDGISSGPDANRRNLPFPTAQDPEDVSIAVLSHNSSAQPDAPLPVQEPNVPPEITTLGDTPPGDPMEIDEQGVPCGAQEAVDLPLNQQTDIPATQLAGESAIPPEHNPTADDIRSLARFAEGRNERWNWIDVDDAGQCLPARTEVAPQYQDATQILMEGEKIVVLGEHNVKVAISEEKLDQIYDLSISHIDAVTDDVLISRPEILSEVEFTKDIEIKVGTQKMLLPAADVQDVLKSKLREMVEEAMARVVE
ncbi:hypothetical protein BSKO_04239 [Bryopsis sp. KO-2023]|nr:hypothetical protein BSKO_04239 [Bryopsis sp. KO-2023]